MLKNKSSSPKTLLADTYENPLSERPSLTETKKFAEKEEAFYKNPLWRLFYVLQTTPSLIKTKQKRLV